MSKKITYLVFVTFIFIILMFIGLTFIEAVQFQGFVRNSFNISLKLLFIVLVIFGIIADGEIYLILKKKETLPKDILNYRQIIFSLNDKIFPILLILSSVFLFVNRESFRSFIKSWISFDPIFILHFLGLSTFLFVLARLFPIRQKQQISLNGIFNKHTFEMLSLMVFFTSSLIIFYGGTSLWWFKGIESNPISNYDQKMSYVYGSFYYYMKFVNSNTPSNAVIMRMKQDSKWPWLSNDPFVRYFIYPRYTKEGDQNSLSDPTIKYVFIHKRYILRDDGWDGERWPDFPIAAKRVLYMRNDSMDPVIVNGDYDPQDRTYERLWGLIELRRS